MGDNDAAFTRQTTVEGGENTDTGADKDVGQRFSPRSGEVVGVDLSLLHDIRVFGVPFLVGHNVEVAPVVFADVVAQIPFGAGEIEIAGGPFGAAIGGSVVASKNAAIDVFTDPFTGGFGLFDAFGGQIPGGAMSFSKFGGEVTGIAFFGRFDGDVAFGFTVSDKNEFKGAMVI